MNLMIPEVTIEECAEVIQAITKYIRFGPTNSGYDNKAHLEEEIGQLYQMLAHLEHVWSLDTANIELHADRKRDAIREMARYNVCNQTQPEPTAT